MYVMESLSVMVLFIYAIQVFHEVFKNNFLIPLPKYSLFVHKKHCGITIKYSKYYPKFLSKPLVANMLKLRS